MHDVRWSGARDCDGFGEGVAGQTVLDMVHTESVATPRKVKILERAESCSFKRSYEPRNA